MYDNSRPIRILHLEDDPNDAELIKAQLIHAGLLSVIHRVDTGQAFEGALAEDAYDLILIDYSMHGYDGRRAVAASRQRRSDVPIIVVSGMAGEEAAIECLHLGAVDYVLKQRPARFVPAVERALREAETRRQNARAEALMREATDIRIRAGEQLRLAIEAAPAGMIVADRAGRMTLVNAEAERLFGYLRPEMLGRSIEILVPPRFRDRRGTLLAGFDFEGRTGGTAADPDLCGLRKDGSELPIEVRLNPLDTPEGDFVLCSVVDLTERKQSEARLQGLNAELQELVRERTSELKEREALLHEVHHRVKNNLQVISSLINMQARKLDDPASRAALADCESRVQAMARIHEMLYVSKDYARVPFAEYVRKLTAQVVGVAGSVPALVSVELNLQPVSLPVQLAIPCGLILNELLGNSLNHAFPEKSGGRIRIDLEHTRGRGIQLSVSDDGVGFPKTLLNVQQSFGMQLVETLVDQLEGRLEIVGPPGTTVSVSFPAKTSAIDPGET